MTLLWKRETEDFKYQTYNRGHEWVFPGGVRVSASSAPEYLGEAERVNPEEAFIASLSACHMLTFLALATRKRLVVDSYQDEATGELAKNAEGRMVLARVLLRPKVAFGDEGRPEASVLKELQRTAHEQCFLANSVKTAIEVQPR